MRVLLLAGGISSEREVSLNSGRAVHDALIALGHDVTVFDPGFGKPLTDISGAYLSELELRSWRIEQSHCTGRDVLTALLAADVGAFDIAFIALHGGMGEDGTAQAILDFLGIPYTGSGVLASALAMNKAKSKQLFDTVQVRNAAWTLCTVKSEMDAEGEATRIGAAFEFPLVVKPNRGGSTVGLAKVGLFSELAPALLVAGKEDHEVLVEQFIAGRELTVAVLSGSAFPIVEIHPLGGLYDYTSKYTKGKSEYFCPAPVEENVTRAIQRAAIDAYKVLGCEGLARIDFILAPDNHFYCLEVNTLPGMTALSLAPMAAKAAGVDFATLIQRQLETALRLSTQ